MAQGTSWAVADTQAFLRRVRILARALCHMPCRVPHRETLEDPRRGWKHNGGDMIKNQGVSNSGELETGVGGRKFKDLMCAMGG